MPDSLSLQYCNLSGENDRSAASWHSSAVQKANYCQQERYCKFLEQYHFKQKHLRNSPIVASF
jgi:hypothetical protein